MAILKCKICGGDMEVSPDKSFGTCEYCGTTMTLPKIDDEQRAAAFNRGNHFRRTGEFDKALQVYERIITEDPNDAEAHWCCALCRYGIEWVEDPATMEYLPTCHRASFDIFTDDIDCKAAIELSDGVTKRQYQKDAVKIADVQKGILLTSQKEEPFDVFICYKETDENGNRTVDSTLAQDVYYQLTDKGLRVFFARITLEDKAGSQYEPYIFAALHSAKVMVVIGTKPEHFGAVWVKNEWSRFLSLVKKDRNKALLPCYKDMDPYDLPKQLAVLQSYDMSKIGFIQDLIRGVKKIAVSKERVATQSAIGEHSEAKELALEDGGLYVGEAIAGKPHGKGKCIYSNGTYYDGEWSFGKRCGQGTKQYTDSKYIGEWKDDKQNGQGTLYWNKGGEWTGEFKDDKRWNGSGTWYYTDSKYVGIWKNGKRDGQGTLYWNEGGEWTGEFKDNECWNGSGTWYYTDAKCVGIWKDGKRDGQGTLYWNGGGEWTGEFKDDKRWNGKGIVYYDSGTKYDGELKSGNRDGQGTYYYTDSKYVGIWKDNKRNGQGTLYWNEGGEWTGEFKDNECWNGSGTWYYPDAKCVGAWKDGKRNGQGTLYWNAGGKWTGEYKNDERWNGKGIVHYNNGTKYDGELKSGSRDGQGTFYYTDSKYVGIWKDNKRNGQGTIYWNTGGKWTGEYKDDEYWTGSGTVYFNDGTKRDCTIRRGKESGCYIATCVYGSYDCPEVWTLRRYRDDTLGATWYGRAFIRTYYAISPTLVKWFGHTTWFKKLWRGKLVRMVKKLQASGVENTPYQDRDWRHHGNLKM